MTDQSFQMRMLATKTAPLRLTIFANAMGKADLLFIGKSTLDGW